VRYFIFFVPFLLAIAGLTCYAATYKPPMDELTFDEAVKNCLLEPYEPQGVMLKSYEGQAIVSWVDGGQPTASFVIHRRLESDKAWDQLGLQHATGVRNLAYAFTDPFSDPIRPYVYGVSTVYCRQSSRVVEAVTMTP